MRNKTEGYGKHGHTRGRGHLHNRGRRSYSRGRGHSISRARINTKFTKHTGLKKAILLFLKRKKTPQKTIEIAHGCGCTTTKEVNPTIYGLEKQKFVIRVSTAPPKWKLDPENVEMRSCDESDEEMESSSSLNATASNVYSCPRPQQQSTNQPFTSQEVDLFGAHGENLFEENNVEPESIQVEATLENIHLHNEHEASEKPFETEGVKEKEDDGNGGPREKLEMSDCVLGMKEERDDDIDAHGIEEHDQEEYSVPLQERLADLMALGQGNADYYEEDLDTSDFSEDICSDSQETALENLAVKSESVDSGQKSTESPEIPLSSSVTNMDGMDIPKAELSFEHQVLLHLSNRPLSTAVTFVLVKEMNSSLEHVENALKTLEEKKIVKRNGTAWQVTKTGDDFLSSKGLKQNKSPVVNQARDGKTVFHAPKTGIGRGLPLSPLELANSSTVFGNKDGKCVNSIRSSGRGLQLKKAIELSKNIGLPPGRGHGVLCASSGEPESRSINNLMPNRGIPTGNAHVFLSPQEISNVAVAPQQQMSQKLPQQMYVGGGKTAAASSVLPKFHIPPSPMMISGQQSSFPLNSSQMDRPEQMNKSSSLDVRDVNQSRSSASNMAAFTNVGISSESFAALNKNPISALMEYAQSRHTTAKIEVIRQSGPPHKPNFEIACFVGNRQFPVVNCQNKKDGRKEAADVAMRTLIAQGAYKITDKSSIVNIAPSQMTHFDGVAALVHQAFNVLIASIPEALAGRKIIAGLVMKRHENDKGVVISIGSGNRCITGEQLSLEGNTVNDSHAEIITRRGFIRFLYKQLESYDPSKPQGLFEKGSRGKLRIRPTITFHLYISTAPCGDGALFSPRDTGSNNAPLDNVNSRDHHPTFTSTVQGLLRTKMEGGEGTIPIESDFVEQTFDGIVRGERLRTMSCTDKICRWNVVGMQGALLSHFIEPVYLDSLTLGFLYDHGHLARAICCRVNRTGQPIDELLPEGYHLNHPWLGRVTACDPSRETQKTKNLSINWSFGDQQPEVIDGPRGLCHTGVEKGFFSRVTKKHLYDSFKRICVKFNRTDLAAAETYNKAKMAATDFQAAKKALQQKLKESKYGPWVSKPVEEEMFS